MVWGVVNNEVYCYFFFLKKENKVGVVVIIYCIDIYLY